jgi:hypothetical protein
MGARRKRRELLQQDMAHSRQVNGLRKAKERVRRQARLRAALQHCSPPYTPTICSWLSAALGKPSRYITSEDIQSLLH